MITFQRRNILDEGYLSIAMKYLNANQKESGLHYLKQALETNPDNEAALKSLQEHDSRAYAELMNKRKQVKVHNVQEESDRFKIRRKSDGEVVDYSHWNNILLKDPLNTKV